MRFHPETLTVVQKRILQRLAPFTSRHSFYLAGGTALAIYLGHRRSQDFDWFTSFSIPDALDLAASIREEGLPFITGTIEKGTLNGSISKVRISFFEYQLSPVAEGNTLAGVWLPPGFPSRHRLHEAFRPCPKGAKKGFC